MPYKPPICPAYAQSQCLTLSPIPEAKSKVTSPVLSCKSSLFSGFDWTSTLSPLMSQTCDHLRRQQDQHAESSSASSAAGTSLDVTSPTILDKLEQLNLQQHTDTMPGISSILEQQPPLLTPTTPDITTATNLGLGIGFNFLALPQSSTTTDIVDGKPNSTPFNTPARPVAPKPIRTSFDLAAIEMKLMAPGEMPLTPPYEEDMNDDELASLAEGAKEAKDNNDDADDDTAPLDTWILYRIEEAKTREEFERESAEILMTTSPVSIAPINTHTIPPVNPPIVDEHLSANASSENSDIYEDACDLSSPCEEKELNLLNKEVDDAIVVTQGKRISLSQNCAIATLKRRSRLMGLHREADGVAGDADGLPEDDDSEEEEVDDGDMKVDEFGVKLDELEKALPAVTEVEVAMNEDRTSPKYSIFSPTSRLPHRRSVSFAKPEVTQVKTFGSSPLAPKSHKRKASATSLFNITSTSISAAPPSVLKGGDDDDILHITANGARSTRSFSTGALYTDTSTAGDAATAAANLQKRRRGLVLPPAPPKHLLDDFKRKRARRSSSIASSLAFTSNSLVPIFSSAFLKNADNKEKDGGGGEVASSREIMKTPKKKGEEKENDNGGKKTQSNTQTPSAKKRGFGISVSLSFRRKS